MIRTERLTKLYDGKPAVLELDLSIQPGEVFGFLGPNGAGKSTTVKILAGLIPAYSGRAIVAGYDVADHPLEVKRRLGFVPETPRLYDSLTADGFLDVMGALYHLDPRTSKARRNDLIELFGLGEVRNQRLREFSKGMRQKVVIASALIHRPEVLILDEPFDGLDANTALVMKGLLREMAAQGKTILFSSHVLEVVERICTRICIIDGGRKVAEGSAEQIRMNFRAATLDEAFSRLTGEREASQVTADILAALARS
ncbi:MAG: ABC transporter ATP-binding protein [Acidobacteria bacterium]|nr:ABC transporter ATP-binding protein [Acidobacteriota bacterium]